MTNPTLTGKSAQPPSDENSVLYDYWLTYLKNIAHQCIIKSHLKIYIGDKYTADDFWLGLILHALTNLSLDEAADRHNDYLWKEKQSKQRRKTSPKQYGGWGDREERLFPNGDQLRKFRNGLPDYIVKSLNQFIFDVQLEYALEHKLITKEIVLIVDNTDQWYYGSDRYPYNPYITEGYNGPGTKHKRKYIALMIKSGSTYLYYGVDLVKKHGSNVPFMIQIIDRLIQQGFTIKYVLGDRWFPTYDFLSELSVRGVNYIGPYKKYAKIKKLLVNYLKKGGKFMDVYFIKGAPAQFYHSPQLQVFLIFTNRRGKRLREIRKEYLMSGKKPEEFLDQIMVMMTTFVPPRGKKSQQSWAIRMCQLYEDRWNIETGFRDLNRVSPPSNARTNIRKFFMFTIRFWIFNMWHIIRAKFRLKSTKWKSQKKGPTLRQFSYKLLCLEKCI